MANSTLAALTATTGLDGTESLYAVQAGTDRRMTVNMIRSLLQNYLFGLTLSNNATDPTNDIDIGAGIAMDQTNSWMMELTGTLTKRLDATWVAGSGQGGRDAGTLADNTYHVFLIRNPTSGVIDALFSTSPTTPTMPTGYTQKRRIGSIVRLFSAIALFTQLGDEFLLKSHYHVGSASISSATQGSVDLIIVPTGIRVTAIVLVTFVGTDHLACMLGPTGAVLSAGTSLSTLRGVLATGPSGTQGGRFYLLTDTNAQIDRIESASSVGISLAFDVAGWVDRRGRDNGI